MMVSKSFFRHQKVQELFVKRVYNQTGLDKLAKMLGHLHVSDVEAVIRLDLNNYSSLSQVACWESSMA